MGFATLVKLLWSGNGAHHPSTSGGGGGVHHPRSGSAGGGGGNGHQSSPEGGGPDHQHQRGVDGVSGRVLYNDAGVDGGDERREQIEGGEERVGPDGGVASGEAREDRGSQEAA